MKKYLWGLTCCLVLLACKNEETNNNIKKVKIETETKIRVSDFISEFSYIKLETSDSCVLADIREMDTSDSLIYITDVVFKGVFVFNFDGELVRTLYKEGKGPGEYLSVDDFLIDKINNTIEILDRVSQKILIYNLNDFTYKKTISIPITFFFRFSKLDNIYYFQTNNAGNLIKNEITNSEIIAYDISTDNLIPLFNTVYSSNQNQAWEFFNVFDKLNNKDLFISLAWHDKIYKIERNKINPFIDIDNGQRGLPKEIIHGTYDEKMAFLKSKVMNDKIHFFNLLMHKHNNIIIAYGIGYPPKVCYYLNLNNGKDIVCTNNVVNDFLPFLYENVEFFKENNDVLFEVIYPFKEKKNKKLLNYFDVTCNDNPILLMFKLKENEI